MRWQLVSVPLLAATCASVLLGPLPAGGQFPPRPRPVDTGDCRTFSATDFERLVSQLKTERDALDSSWKAVPKWDRDPRPSADQEHQQLQRQLKHVLQRLQDRQARPAPLPTLEPKKPEAIAAEPKKDGPAKPAPAESNKTAPPAKNAANLPAGPVDSLMLAHALFRAEMYEESLAAFRKIDLKGKRASERAPIQYLMACCLQRLGKSEEALPLLRDVANSRGDERLADYAQWQISLIRWQMETRDLLQGARQRRQALEKKI